MIIRLVLSGAKGAQSDCPAAGAQLRLAASRSRPSPLLGNTATIATSGGRKSSLPNRVPMLVKLGYIWEVAVLV
jgi:hypothetical protein